MIIGSLKEVFLVHAKEMFLFDCHVGGFDLQAVNTYRKTLDAFIRFTGNIQVKQLTPDHVEMYAVNLFDGPYEGEEHTNLVMSQYSMIQTWIHWMYAQKFIIERQSNMDQPLHLDHLFPPRSTRKLAHGE